MSDAAEMRMRAAKRMQLFMSTVMADPRATESDFEAGVAFIGAACRGAGARAAVDEQGGDVQHMEQLGVQVEPEPNREAWLFGYRWQVPE